MIEVIGAGFGRTGTASLQAALNQLGFGPCYHGGEVFAEPEDLESWVAAARGERDAWRRPLRGYRSTTDWPTVAFWRTLIHDFPEAKVILTTRDEQEWFESFDQTILRVLRGGWLPGNVAEMFSGQSDAEQLTNVSVRMSREVMVPLSFAGTVAERDHVIECYRQHNAAVRREVPAGRLLEFQVRQGWEPLCAFLEVPVPQHPFPRVNDRATLTR
jgi:hypothetical protein